MTRVQPDTPPFPTEALNELRFGARRVPKMYAQINELRQAIAAEGNPRVQRAWDKVEEHIDFAYQMAADKRAADEAVDQVASMIRQAVEEAR